MKKVNGYLAGKHNSEKWLWMRQCGLDKDIDFQNASHETQGKYWNHARPGDQNLRYIAADGFSGTWSQDLEDNIIVPLQGSEIVIAYLSCATSFGSIAEIGYASALNIPSFIFFDLPSDVFGKIYEDFDTHDDYINYHESPECNKGIAFVDTYWLVSLFPAVRVYCLEECSPREVVLEYLQGISTAFEPATEKQYKYLRSLGHREKPRTKLEASERIHQLTTVLSASASELDRPRTTTFDRTTDT